MTCKQLTAEETVWLLGALHQGDDRVTTHLLVQLAGITRAGTYDVVVDPATGTALIRSADGVSGPVS